MGIKELRRIVNMSQRMFADYFGIPIGTLRNWEQGIAKPPEYVFHMIIMIIRRDKMINIETIKFMNLLNELAELSQNGIEPFENANEETYRNKIYFDSKEIDEDGNYKVVLDACVTDDNRCYHHDIISYYGNNSNEYKVRVVIDEDEIPFVCVTLLIGGEEVVIENGRWYLV